jgi:SPP1 gp7 family putative phage head morphogenesis protein
VSGFFDKSYAQAEALVRTSVMAVANQTHLDVYEANLDVISQIQWLSTLDLRTTPICQGLDSKTWDAKTYAPIGHSFPFPGPTAHWNCRSTQIPVTKSWEELAKQNKALAKQMDALPDSTRASMDGQVAQKMTYEEFLQKLPEKQQMEVLGSKYDLWAKTKELAVSDPARITLADMLDQKGNPLSLTEFADKAGYKLDHPDEIRAHIARLEEEAKRLAAEAAKAEADSKRLLEAKAAVEATKTEKVAELAKKTKKFKAMTAVEPKAPPVETTKVLTFDEKMKLDGLIAQYAESLDDEITWIKDSASMEGTGMGLKRAKELTEKYLAKVEEILAKPTMDYLDAEKLKIFNNRINLGYKMEAEYTTQIKAEEAARKKITDEAKKVIEAKAAEAAVKKLPPPSQWLIDDVHGSYVPPPEIKEVLAKIDGREITELAKWSDVIEKSKEMFPDLVDAIETAVENAGQIDHLLLENADEIRSFIRIDIRDLISVLEDGRFKSQFETGTSGGVMSFEFRARVENALFGYAEDVSPDLRPIYGYMSDHYSAMQYAEQYGNLTVGLRNEIASRTSMTFYDSLDNNITGVVTPKRWTLASSGFSDVNLFSDRVKKIESLTMEGRMREAGNESARLHGDIRNYIKKTNEMMAPDIQSLFQEFGNHTDYIEAQFHGGVKVSDIENIDLGVVMGKNKISETFTKNLMMDTGDLAELFDTTIKNDINLEFRVFEGNDMEIWRWTPPKGTHLMDLRSAEDVASDINNLDNWSLVKKMDSSSLQGGGSYGG